MPVPVTISLCQLVTVQLFFLVFGTHLSFGRALSKIQQKFLFDLAFGFGALVFLAASSSMLCTRPQVKPRHPAKEPKLRKKFKL